MNHIEDHKAGCICAYCEDYRAEVVTLKQRVKELTAAAAKDEGLMEWQSIAIQTLTDGLKEEKALLDWYEANPNSVIFSSGYRGEKGSWSYRDSGKFSTDALTLRDAIRAARNAARPR